MEETASGIIKLPMGVLRITADDEGVTGLHFCGNDEQAGEEHALKGAACQDVEKAQGCLAQNYVRLAKNELSEYFAGTRTVFTVPLHEQGTPFQKRVWAALRAIPYGETRSYGQIAAQIGNPKAARAVGMANNRNPIMIITPCHRVIGADGSLVGFGGGLPMKKYLLELEKRGTGCVPDRV